MKSPIIQSQDYYPFGLTFNSYQREDGLNNPFQYNGKEVQDEGGLGWVDYGARMYMPELGRWGAMDPHSSKYEIVTPYNYAFNNPILFLDPTGKDNVIYLMTAGKFDSKEAKKIEDAINKMFKALGLETKAVLFDEKKSGKFDESKLDKTDNWAVIRNDRKAIAAKASEISSDDNYDKRVDDWSKVTNEPEVSNNSTNSKGIVVDFGMPVTGGDKTEAAGLATIHGAGHSSERIQESQSVQSLEYGHLDQGVMMNGNYIRKTYQRWGNIDGILGNNPTPGARWKGNETYITGMMERHGTNHAKVNYGNK